MSRHVTHIMDSSGGRLPLRRVTTHDEFTFPTSFMPQITNTVGKGLNKTLNQTKYMLWTGCLVHLSHSLSPPSSLTLPVYSPATLSFFILSLTWALSTFWSTIWLSNQYINNKSHVSATDGVNMNHIQYNVDLSSFPGSPGTWIVHTWRTLYLFYVSMT